jgi:F-type H+-transporting ATPase subunit epsilon
MSMEVQVVSPDRKLFSGSADFLVARTVEGEIGILPGHTPILAQLVAPSEVKLKAGSDEQRFRIAGGFMSVKDNKVIVLAEEVGPEGDAAP